MPSTYIYGSALGNPKQTVGTTRQTLLGAADRSSREVWITVDDANSGKLFLGDNTVTSSGGGNVFAKLQAGSTAVVQIGYTGELYAVGSAASQVYYVGVLE